MSNPSRFSIERAENGVLRLTLTLMILLALTACARPPGAALRFGLPTAPATLDPRHASDAQAARLCRLLYAQLVDFDIHFRPQPALALRWEALSPRHYRVWLRADSQFHDGSPITANDVAASYRSVLDPAQASAQRGPLAHIKSIVVRDARTLDFRLQRDDPLFPGLLTLGILRAAEISDPPRNPGFTGSGAFRLRERPSSHAIRMTRVVDGLELNFIVVADETTRALMLSRGELDVIQGSMTPEISGWLATQEGLVVSQHPGTVYTYLGFNLADGPTRDRRVRLAIAHAIDRAAIVRYAFRGQARLAPGLLVPEHWAGVKKDRGPAYDPAAARALLKTLGYGPGHPLRLQYKTSSDPFRRRLANLLQYQLGEAGIALDIQSHDWGTFFGDIRAGNFELYSLSWVGLQLPDIYRQAFHSASVPPVGANRGRYVSAGVDALIADAERAQDEPTRARIFRRIAAEIAHDLPYVSLWHEHGIVVTGPRARGYATDLHGQYDQLAHIRLPESPLNVAQH